MQEQHKCIKVVAAIIQRNDLIFATQRGYGEWKDWWEFPGGKIEPNESAQDALRREIREELNCEIIVGDLLTTVEYDYPNFHLSMQCYLCSLASGKPQLLEHEDARWLKREELETIKWLPADEDVIQKMIKVIY
ncbi:MAG: (deoxy)nucleoside triphosphate pyrophosphohydrolase [Prevotella sp.]|nr:(deoxy)nucleoside triphosphate pyrophosphohydrolase [Prevotella sp.]MDE6808371.1 (deoxy)nucleoside triphosphate pyrophosphohydrolase [Prevotella sp.]